MKSKIRVGRLRRLAKHLRGKHLFHKKFDFNELTEGKMDKDGNYCGSSGCAMGEFPAIWPKEWRWEQYKYRSIFDVVHKSQQDANNDTDYKVIAKFFSITERQVNHLFESYSQNIKSFGGKELDMDATAEDVADNIDAFIEKVAL